MAGSVRLNQAWKQHIEKGDASSNQDGSQIEEGEIDNPNGAQTSVFISNGIVYKEALVNLDATAATSLGAVVDGNLVIFK